MSAARSTQARLAASERHRPDQDHTELRTQYKSEQLADHIRRVADSAPPLTPAQRDRLAMLLTGGDAA